LKYQTRELINVCLDQEQGTGGRPTFSQSPQVRMFEESALLECRCTADPIPSFTWTLDGKPIVVGTKYKQGISTEGNTHTIFLEVSQLTKKDSGVYKVTAKNTKGDGSANIELNIEGVEFKFVDEIFLSIFFLDNYDGLFRLPEGLAPSFLGKPTIKQTAKTATIQIDIAADPSPSLHWSKDRKDLLNVDKTISRLDRKGGNKYTVYLDIKVHYFPSSFIRQHFSFL
jgi:hypothetical protein